MIKFQATGRTMQSQITQPLLHTATTHAPPQVLKESSDISDNITFYSV